MLTQQRLKFVTDSQRRKKNAELSWWSSTRGMSQIWIELRNFLRSHFVLVTSRNSWSKYGDFWLCFLPLKIWWLLHFFLPQKNRFMDLHWILLDFVIKVREFTPKITLICRFDLISGVWVDCLESRLNSHWPKAMSKVSASFGFFVHGPHKGM